MTGQQLQAALRPGAEGLYALESGTGLLLAHGTWPAREDFRCFIHVAGSNTSVGTELASIDWEAAIAALDAGERPGSGGEKRMLRLAASLAADVPSTPAAPSPGSTTATSASWSRRSCMPPGNASFLASGCPSGAAIRDGGIREVTSRVGPRAGFSRRGGAVTCGAAATRPGRRRRRRCPGTVGPVRGSGRTRW
jgi:hypothetical protein